MDKVKKQNLIFMNFDQILSDRFGRYSKYIIQDRALPDVRDGLKPVQRRILYAMYDLKLLHNYSFKKSARVVGEVIGKYHPHGDSSIYEAMVRMSQTWKMNAPLIDMHGNNGSIDDDPAAAMRYTEARLSKISESMLINIHKESVVFAPNFDDSESEPTVLPGIFPNLLVNGAKGIASGFATEMPPHNLKEIIDAIITRIKSPNCRLATLLEIVKGPDFPTGGTVIDDGGIFQAFERGSGRIIVRSKYIFNTTKGNPSITIFEIPYGVVKSKLVKEIDDIAESNLIYGIKEVRDETDREGLRIHIGLVPGTNVQTILAYLLQKTQMQVYYSYNNVVITNKTPRELNLTELIDEYIKHQQIVIRNYSQFDLKNKKDKLEIVEGLIKVAGLIDIVISIIRNAENSKEGVINALIDKLNFTKLQANAIADLRLYRLSKTDQETYMQEKTKLVEEISFLSKILNDENELNNYLVLQLKAFSKEFGSNRKTTIETESDLKTLQINTEDLIKNEDVYVGVSNFGYLKSLSNKSFEANKLESYKLKEEDSLIYMQKVNTLSKLVFITNKGRYITIPVYKISGDAKWSALGQHLNDLTTLYNLEKIVSVFEIKNFKNKQWVSIATKEGKIKRLEIEEFNSKRYTLPSICFSLTENDEVVGAKISDNARQVILIASDGKAVKYPETTITPTGPKSGGIKGITLNNNYVSAIAVGTEQQIIGILSSRGGAKRVKISSIAPYSRTSQGKPVFATFKNTPHIPICVDVIQPQTYFSFTHKNGEIEYLQFNTIEISNEESGFVGSSLITNGAILTELNYKDTEKNSEDLTLEERFTNIEQKMEKISQMSLDELMKKVK